MAPRFALLLCIASVAALAVANPTQAAVESFGGTGPGAAQFLGAAVSASGEVYVADAGNDRVERFTGDGSFVGDLGVAGPGPGSFDFPQDVAFDSSGDIFVADDDHRLIQRFSATGAFLGQWPVAYAPTQPGLADLAIASEGTVYLADYRLNRVRRFTSDGMELSGWGEPGSAPGQFSSPMGVALASDGTVYVADLGNHRLQHFTATGGVLGEIAAGLDQPTDVAVGTDGDLYVTDAGRKQVLRLAPSGAPRGRYALPGAPQSVAVGPGGLIYVTISDRVFRIDTTAPLPRMTSSAPAVSTGDTMTFDASGSEVPLGSIARYEWDLNGDGSFELDTGTTPIATTSYANAGSVAPAVRVTSQTGLTAITTTQVQVHLASAPGPIGVSINGGAQFTNRPEVDLIVRWPIFADHLITANDGGFSSASTTPVASHVRWTLDSSGPERLPKTVYLRFDQSTQTFQDDIILDQTPPEVTEAGEEDHDTGGDRAGLARYARASSAVKSSIKLKAADNASGVRNVQFAVDRSAPSTPVAYSTRLAVTGSPRWVRVQDGAGNWSAWRAIARPNRPDLTIPAQRLRQLVRGLTVKVTCRQACVVKARLTVARGDARRLHLRGTTLATGKATGLKAGVVRVRIRPKSKVARRIGRLRKLRVTVTGTIATAKGISPVAKSITLRR